MNCSTAASIASEADLEAFCNQPIEERSLTEPLRGVLAETAITGVVRYKWALLRPLVEFAMEKVMRDYDGQGQDAVGPSRYSSYGETVMQTVDRFKTLLSAFADAPWTLQRMCELLLEPRKQYTQLHKVALAIEKCLLVTSEVPTSSNPPPVPHLDTLSNVNSNPPPVYPPAPVAPVASAGEGAGDAEEAAGPGVVLKVREDASGSAAFVGSLLEVRVTVEVTGSGAGPQGPGSSSGGGGGAAGTAAPHRHPTHHVGAGNHSGSMEHIEEDHWPENKAGPGLHNALHHRDKDSQHHPPQQAAAQPSLPAPHSLLPLLGQQRQTQQAAAGSPGSSPPSSRHSSEPPAGSAAAAADAAEQPDVAPCSKGAGLEQDQDMAEAAVAGQDAVVGGKGAAPKEARPPGAEQQTGASLMSNGMEE